MNSVRVNRAYSTNLSLNLFNEISLLLEHVYNITLTYKVDLKRVEEVVRIEEFHRYDKSLINKTSQDARLFTLENNTIFPKKLYQYAYDENIDTYENRFILFLLVSLENDLKTGLNLLQKEKIPFLKSGISYGEYGTYSLLNRYINNEDKLLKEEKKNFAGLTGEALCTALKEAASKANSHLRSLVCKMPDYEGMGTTLVAVYLAEDKKAYALNIGDSRLYLWRNGLLKQITQDHSYVAELLSKGDITTDEARRHPQRNVILRAVGADEGLDSDVFSFETEPGDRLLLCSDGLSDMAADDEIAAVLKEENTEKAADALIELALNNGGRDNVSVILIDFCAEEI